MAIKNILVSFNALPSSRAALGVASLMARKYDAHLTGVLSHGPSRISSALAPWLTADLMTTVREVEASRRTEIREQFESASAELQRERPGRVHYLDLGGDADESLMEAARVYDIVVMGARESSHDTAHLAPHPDLVALQGGRPVLIVPAGYETDRLVERAVLAWDGGRAAARALSDAMTILETKSHVTVLSVGDEERLSRREGLDPVAHLARHGIQSAWKQTSRPLGGPASVILDVVQETGAGLLVMGAYEHSKFSEDLVGGVTKTILRDVRVPVLMSH